MGILTVLCYRFIYKAQGVIIKVCIVIFGIALLLINPKAMADRVDCSEAYKARATCEQVTCSEKFRSFIGTWTGPFESYSEELSTTSQSVYRPIQNTVTYEERDCLRNLRNGDVFIIGRRTDFYPAFQYLPPKTEKGLLITGRRSNGSPFLKTIGTDGNHSYKLVYQNKPANTSIWRRTIPASKDGPEMTFTIIDGQDFNEAGAHKRNVVVTLTIGVEPSPIWQGLVSTGYHTLNK